jgi:anti-sigma regulatory factor (Ser/Thr protein kinase)
MLPELLDAVTRPDLIDDLDLVLSELAGNAVRHAGGITRITLARLGASVRLGVGDGVDRAPTVRQPVAAARREDPIGVQEMLEGGRGMFLVAELSERWGVDHDWERPGKLVWAELALGSGAG